jgi:DNA adenine methylase
MRPLSPLRYPGGKSVMAGLLGTLRRINCLGDRAIAEPFAGGAGASLSLLALEETPNIYINDADPAIHDFWWSLLNLPDEFLELLSKTTVNMKEWCFQRAVYRSNDSMSRLCRGFAAFYLNRCNRSGIIVNGGPIGGTAQTGKWKLNARYNKKELRQRCENIIQYRERINVSGEDGIKFIERLDPDSTFFFIDPPYYEKGPTLYLNALNEQYHKALAAKLQTMSDGVWALTYDDCPEIRSLYCDWATVQPFKLRYVAAERRTGNELLITPKWMMLPRAQDANTVAIIN